MLSDLDRKKIYYNGIENLVFMKENLHVHLAKPEVNVSHVINLFVNKSNGCGSGWQLLKSA